MTKTAYKFVVPRKSAICLTTNWSRHVYRDTTTELSRTQFLTRVSHSMGAHTEALCLTADSSSSDEDETYEVSPATTSESSESPATAAALLKFTLKGKYKKIWPTKSDRFPFFTAVDVRLAVFCCMNQWSISVQSSTVCQPINLPPFAVCPSVRGPSVRDTSDCSP